jgi:hypothetical protein
MVIAGWSNIARADSWILDYIESWSGPGPYSWTQGFDVNVACLATADGSRDSRKEQYWNCHLDDPKKVRAMFTFKASWGDNDANQLFSDDPNDRRNVKQTTIEALFIYRLNTMIDVGAGMQWAHLSDDAQAATATTAAYFASSLWRTGPALRVTFTPLGFLDLPHSLSRIVHVEYESAFFGGTSTAADYGNFVSRYSARKEFQSRVGVAIDIAPLLSAIHSR